MADGVAITAGSGTTIATDDTGATGHAQIVKLAISTDGSSTLIPADATFGLEVDVSRIQAALPSGTNGIGTVGVTSLPSIPAGANAIGSVTVSSLPSTPAGTNYIGKTRLTDGTNDLVVDTLFNDGESSTENHLNVGAKIAGLNYLNTWDGIRASVSVNKTVTQTTAQTGSAIWTPASGKAVVITSLQIQSYGVTAGTAVVWFGVGGASPDNSYTRGTDAAVFDGEFAPTATNKPGVFVTFPTPIRGAADFVLRLTTTNVQSITVSVWGYEI